jgi:hypothetical protein
MRALKDEVLPSLEAVVLAPAPDGSVASQRLFATRLRRCVRSADAGGEQQRRRSAAGRRTAYGRLVEDGMGTFTVVARPSGSSGSWTGSTRWPGRPGRPVTAGAWSSCVVMSCATWRCSASCRPAPWPPPTARATPVVGCWGRRRRRWCGSWCRSRSRPASRTRRARSRVMGGSPRGTRGGSRRRPGRCAAARCRGGLGPGARAVHGAVRADPGDGRARLRGGRGLPSAGLSGAGGAVRPGPSRAVAAG